MPKVGPRGPRRQPNVKNPALKKARIEQAIEWQLKGVPVKDVAQLSNVDPETVRKWNKEAEAKGWIDSIRERMSARLLPLMERTYETVLNADVDQMTAKGTVKAHTLKLKAAKELADGLAVFQKHSKTEVKKTSMNLDGYYELRQTRAAAKPPEAVDGEILPNTHIRQLPPSPETKEE